MVQPFFEALVVFAWCVIGGVVPDNQTPEPPREQVVNAQAAEVFKNLTRGVGGRNSDQYLSQFSPELRKKHEGAVRAVLDSPKRHNLVMRYKLEPVSVGSYEATYKAKILTESVCPTSGYQSNVEYATVTIAPAAQTEGENDGRFDSQPAEPRWEITKWETEKVVPYDKSKDR